MLYLYIPGHLKLFNKKDFFSFGRYYCFFVTNNSLFGRASYNISEDETGDAI